MGKRFRKAQEITASWSAERREQLLRTPEIQTLLDTLRLAQPQTVRVSSASVLDVKKVTGLDFSRNTGVLYSNWDLDTLNPLLPITPSPTFTEQLARIKQWFRPAKEALTRSIVDTVDQHNPEKNLTLSGDMDYIFGYGDMDAEHTHNIVLIIAAKNGLTPIGGKTLVQLFAYMAMVFGARRAAKKKNPGSEAYKDRDTVLRHLIFFLRVVTAASPNTTPFGSSKDLAQSELVQSLDLPGYEPTTTDTAEGPQLDREVENYYTSTAGLGEFEDDGFDD
ncbi:hypothetical protein HDU85_005831 [Gaertneriomyces sp. JEL0708]|nr:hypothetical protein HDU85_005831 [Gaertneriomyces sp. JEL0708]